MNKQAIAQLLDQAAMNAEAVEQISGTQSFTENQAYEIQALAMEERYKRGDHFVGLKLGFTSFAKMEQMGVHDMIWGPTNQKYVDRKRCYHRPQFIYSSTC